MKLLVNGDHKRNSEEEQVTGFVFSELQCLPTHISHLHTSGQECLPFRTEVSGNLPDRIFVSHRYQSLKSLCSVSRKESVPAQVTLIGLLFISRLSELLMRLALPTCFAVKETEGVLSWAS